MKADCKDCHKDVRYRETPSECIACHRKDDKHEANLGTDCAACHTDADWKARRFDHARTRFALREAHRSPPLKCDACHRDLKSYRPSPLECVACHRRDDRHDDQLGRRCENCHGEREWRVRDYDHGRARFALDGAHVKVACKDCHTSARFRDATRECDGCHRKDDKHRRAFGEKCEACHGTKDWKTWDFDHGRRTEYPLASGHEKVACTACHRMPAPRGRLAAAVDNQCVSCHRRDDVHDGAFGPRCDQCHLATQWRQITNRRFGPRARRAPVSGDEWKAHAMRDAYRRRLAS